MTESPSGGNGREAAGEDRPDPAVQKRAETFQTPLSEPAPERRVLETVAPLPMADPAPSPTLPDTGHAAEPSRQPTAVLEGSGGRDAESGSEPALDRPGAPVLAGAAIAGALLVIAPFAATASMPALSLDTAAQQTPVTNALGVQTGDDSAQAAGSAASVADGGNGSPAVERAADPGFVPEVQDGGDNPTLPDPGNPSEGTDAVEASAPAEQGAGTEVSPAQNASAESTGAGGPATEDGSAGSTDGAEAASGEAAGGGGPGGEGAEGAEGAAVTGGGDGAVDGSEEPPGESSADGTEGASAAGSEGSEESGAAAGEDAPASDENDAPDTDTMSGAGEGGSGANGGETPTESPLIGSDSPETSSILANATERVVPVEDRYRALTGPGCASTGDSSYGDEGRWESAEGSASWATRTGGYDQEGCEGSYDAIPVSGDAERGDHQSASWTFVPGHEGAVCEIYVHVPEDESPLWIASGEARYQIHPGGDAEEAPVAVFGFDQSQIPGGWVQVTGFVAPDEEFTVRLTNAGEDPFPDEEHANAHVAASAMRVDCS